MAERNNLSDALALEKNRFMKFLSEAAGEEQTEVAALEGRLAARGLLLSGNRYSGEVEIRLAKIRNVVEKVIALRRELGWKVPKLLEEQHLERLRDDLDRYVDSAVAGFIDRISSRPPDPGGAVRDALRSLSEREARSIQAKVRSELQALRLESRLGLHQEQKPVAAFNISNSTIASLNLGTVLGDLTASVQTLAGQGQVELADAIRTLTEAITASKDLQNAQRKELLEHLSLVSTEVSLPSEKRKMGPLKSSIAFLQGSLSTVAQLASLWSAAEQGLKAVGVLSS